MITVSMTVVSHDVQIAATLVKKIVQYVCLAEKVKVAELSFVIINDARIRTINRKFLGHDYVTDVITFPLELKEVSAEIYINGMQAKRQAKENHVSVRNEMTRLVVHGTLHAMGYDDTTPTSKKRMDSIQERYVSELSLYL
ncbi:MAG: rRNA maturation RNase YbeY [Bacteroidota bacterium]